MSEEDSEKWWTVSETAQRLRLSERTVLQRIKFGRLEAKRKGKRWLVSPLDVRKKSEMTSEDSSLLRETIDLLKRELEEKNRQISELHILLGREALHQGQESKSWWKFWRR